MRKIVLGVVLGCVVAALKGGTVDASRDHTVPRFTIAPTVSTARTGQPVVQKRRGIVRLDGRTFADDDGPYLGLGTTLFWAAWGYRFDRLRLEQNLQFLSGKVDYIRVLGCVGPEGGWEARTTGPSTDAEFDATIAGLTDLAYDTYGLRIEWTLFGGCRDGNTPEERLALLAKFVAMARGRAHKIQHWEVANEGLGFGTPEGAKEIRQLAQRLRDGTQNLVATTSAQDEVARRHWYDGSTANLLTSHLDRSFSGRHGAWQPVPQVWSLGFFWRGGWTLNEPIGPKSSVAEDDDPLRLTMAAGLTWLCNGAGYVLHTGAGIRGLGPADRGREANVFEVPHIEESLAGISALRKVLPRDLPNWTRQNSNPSFPHYPFDVAPIAGLIQRGRLLRAFAATSGGRFIVMPIVAEGPVRFTTRTRIHVEVRDPMTGTLRETKNLDAGATYVLEPTLAAVLIGEPR